MAASPAFVTSLAPTSEPAFMPNDVLLLFGDNGDGRCTVETEFRSSLGESGAESDRCRILVAGGEVTERSTNSSPRRLSRSVSDPDGVDSFNPYVEVVPWEMMRGHNPPGNIDPLFPTPNFAVWSSPPTRRGSQPTTPAPIPTCVVHRPIQGRGLSIRLLLTLPAVSLREPPLTPPLPVALAAGGEGNPELVEERFEAPPGLGGSGRSGMLDELLIVVFMRTRNG